MSKYVYFQAEDGIRDSVASRGLGEVYKKQTPINSGKAMAIQDKLVLQCTTLFRIISWLKRQSSIDLNNR